ncbi:hypothetical protein [Emticicia sp.]|uniref:hypothetical protein n=1 Tax=Emticicia sp. TaxID=1930953 RepID=UPI00374FDF06
MSHLEIIFVSAVAVSLFAIALSLAWYNYLKPMVFKLLSQLLLKNTNAWKTPKLT